MSEGERSDNSANEALENHRSSASASRPALTKNESNALLSSAPVQDSPEEGFENILRTQQEPFGTPLLRTSSQIVPFYVVAGCRPSSSVGYLAASRRTTSCRARQSTTPMAESSRSPDHKFGDAQAYRSAADVSFSGPRHTEMRLPFFQPWVPKPPASAADAPPTPASLQDSCGFKLIMGTVGGKFVRKTSNIIKAVVAVNADEEQTGRAMCLRCRALTFIPLYSTGSETQR